MEVMGERGAVESVGTDSDPGPITAHAGAWPWGNPRFSVLTENAGLRGDC